MFQYKSDGGLTIAMIIAKGWRAVYHRTHILFPADPASFRAAGEGGEREKGRARRNRGEGKGEREKRWEEGEGEEEKWREGEEEEWRGKKGGGGMEESLIELEFVGSSTYYEAY